MANITSQHIMNASANLLGFCLIVITSLHVTDKARETYIDEFTAIIAIFLIFACLFSFISIRTGNIKRETILEKAADYFFISSIAGIMIVIFLITFDLIK